MQGTTFWGGLKAYDQAFVLYMILEYQILIIYGFKGQKVGWEGVGQNAPLPPPNFTMKIEGESYKKLIYLCN